ncbi:MAG: cytochrome c3 family protein [Hyphomicrobium sp.]
MRPWLIMTAVVTAFALVAGVGLRGADDAAAQAAPAAQSKPAEAPAGTSTPAKTTPAKSGRTPLPAITRGKGDKCVAPTDWMRRFHMTALNHKRDDTVHDGIRTPQFSLKACIDCHTVSGADGKAVTVKDERHFCRSCHDYAAVKVDCFECHASRPEGGMPGKGADSAPERKGADSAPDRKGADSAPDRKGAVAGHHGGAAKAEMARLGAALGEYLSDNAGSSKGAEGQRP